MRPETGPMKFGGDWRGVFIRGDNAFAFAQALKVIFATVSPEKDYGKLSIAERIAVQQLHGFLELLESANERKPVQELQHLRPYSYCLPCTHCYKGHYEDPSIILNCPCVCHEEPDSG